MSRALERAIARFRRRPDEPESGARALSAAEFRAATQERMRALEREIADVKARVNGLILALAGAVAAQVVLRLVE
ncbi:MAG: hypothetical protein WD379_01365 [Dehalococcoidia bacterium]